MKSSTTKTGRLLAAICAMTLIAGSVFAGAVPVQEPSSEADIAAALTGGVPLDRWKEGLLY